MAHRAWVLKCEGQYWQGGWDGPYWQDKLSAAIRFSRKRDAKQFLNGYAERHQERIEIVNYNEELG